MANASIYACILYLQSSPVTEYPVDGHGGSYYDFRFPVPVYSRDSTDSTYETTWHQIDDYYKDAASNVIGSAVSFGICFATLLNIIVLTPQSKRRSPLHYFICLALTFQILRTIIQMAILTESLPASSYVYLTNDRQSTSLSHTYYVQVYLSEISAWLSFVFVQACFFIQGRALMTWLSLHHHLVYLSILVYLVLAGVTAAVYRLTLGIFQILQSRDEIASAAVDILFRGTITLYAISVGSWSLVFFISAVSIIANRRQALFNRNSVYDTALNLVAVICIECFIVPIMFCIMQLPAIYRSITSINPEQFIVPSVLFLLPIGGLFVTVHENARTARPNPPEPRHAVSNTHHLENISVVSKPRDTLNHSSLLDNDNLNTQATSTVSELPSSDTVVYRPARGADRYDIELASIDAIDKQERKPNVKGRKNATDEAIELPESSVQSSAGGL